MRRRELLIGGAAIGVWPVSARSQPAERMRRLGMLLNLNEHDIALADYVPTFLQRLAELGWHDGTTIDITTYYTAGDAARWQAAVSQLIAASPDVILTSTGVVVKEFESRTQSIPIVFVLAGDPLGQRLVPSLAHPGGNVTGFSNFDLSIGGKWIELLTQVAPATRHIAYIYDAVAIPFTPAEFSPALQEKLRPSGLDITAVAVQEPSALVSAIEALTRQPNSGVIITPGPLTTVNRALIVETVNKTGLPAIYGYSFFVDGGGLIAYGVDERVQFFGAANYVDRILRGAKPADLPVQAAAKFDLAINLGTAKRLGLSIPPGLVASADRVIE